MQPLTQSLTTAFLTSAAGTTPLDFKGSDGRLEVVLKPGSLDFSHATKNPCKHVILSAAKNDMFAWVFSGFAMKKTLSDVIVSDAKNLKRTPDQEGERAILRVAHNDMSGPVFLRQSYEVDSFASQYPNTVSQIFYDSLGREVEASTPVIPPSDADRSKTYFRVVLTEYSDSTHSTWQSLPFVVQSSTTVSNVNAVGWIDPGGPGNPLKDYNGNIVYGSASYYDALGRVRYVQFDTGANSGTLTANELETIQYNILDEPTSVLVSDLSTQTNESITTVTASAQYDDLGRMTSLTDPDSGTHTYSYDPDGRLIGDTSGAHVLGYSYDLAGRVGCLQDTVLTATTVSANGSCSSGANPFVTNTYDADPTGVTWTGTNYAKGRLTQSVSTNYFPGPDNSQGTVTQNMQYDLRGRLITERQNEAISGGSLTMPTLPQNQMTLTYNDDNQLMMTQTTVGGSAGYTFSQAYDSTTGMLIGLSNNSSGTANLATTSYLYNSQGLNEALNFLTSTGTALATENFSYDGDLRPAGGTATWQSGSGNTVGSTIFSQGTGYDAASNVISQTITQAAVPGQTGSGGSETQNFCYDEQNRLIWSSNHSTTKPTGSITCGSVAWQSTLGGNYTNNFTYTHLGQLWKGPLNGTGPYQYLYCNATSNANQHQLTTVAAVGATCANPGTTSYSASYDSWGNITSRTYNSVTSSYTYDGQNHLLRWNDASNQKEWYWYDATGNRAMKRSYDGTNITITVYAFGLEEHQYSYSGTGSSATNTGNTYYYSLGGRLLGTLSGTSTMSTSFLLTDLLGSLVASFSNTAGSAAVQGNQVYGPYGKQRYTSGNLNSTSTSTLTNKGFTGQYNDVLTGLDYYNARYYDPVVGVFLSADTMQGNLQGMNPYAYVGNNPETRTDPTGEFYAPGTGGGEGGPSGQQLQNNASAYTHHTAPSGGYQNSTLPWLLYMFLYNRRTWGSLEGNAENHGYSFLPTLSEQALSYLHFTSDVNWNASSDLQALYAQLVSLSVLHLVQLSGETGLEGAMDLVGVEAAIDRMATEGGGAFTTNSEGDNAVAGEEGNGSSSGEEGGCSFTATTQVATSHGKQAIGTLHVGEKVWAYNPKTQKMELQPILHVFLDKDNDLVDLTLTTPAHAPHSSVITKKSEVIHTNKKHPFYTLEKGFLSVGQIKLGMHVLRADGRIGVVTRWKIVPGVMTMYNLEVAHDHTFTVGMGEWVVHNTGPTCGYSSQPYDRKLLGKTPSDTSTQQTLANEPTCHWCRVNPSTVADHEPALAQRWTNGDFDNMSAQDARDAADDPAYMVGSCRSCNSSKAGRAVGTGPGEWDPRTSPPNRQLGGPNVLPWIW